MAKIAIKKFQSKSDIQQSKLGYQFDIYSQFWVLDNGAKINWGLFPSLDSKCFDGLRRSLADYAVELSASYCRNIFHFTKEMLVFTGDSTIKLSTVQNYLASLNGQTEYKLGYIRSFLFNWYDKGYEGLDEPVTLFLEQLTLSGNQKGIAVAKRCPHTGAYSIQEQQAILIWGVNAFMEEELSLTEYTWLLLNIYLGARSVQYCHLKVVDLIVSGANKSIKYHLDLPQLKKRGAGFREVVERLEIDEDLALIISNHAQLSIKKIEQHTGRLPEKLRSQVPLFVNTTTLKSLKSLADLKVLIQQTPDAIHLNRENAKNIALKLSQKCQARSERLQGEYIHLRNRRFRYTIGTNAASRGLSAFAIAKILGHADIQNVKVYTENIKELNDEVNEALEPVLAPLVRAFEGQLIESEMGAIRANDPRSRVRNGDGEGVGNCGSYGFCAAGGRACYICAKFQPWIHGKHQVVLDNLMKEREILYKRGVSPIVIQSTDRLVLAIIEVIDLCNKIKSKTGVINE